MYTLAQSPELLSEKESIQVSQDQKLKPDES